MTVLKEFLRDLAIDPRLLTHFVRDPIACIASMELDEVGREALLSGLPNVMWEVLHGRQPAPFEPRHANVKQRSQGTLTVVGTGIRTVGQLSPEAIAWISASEVVHYLVADPIAEDVIRHLNPEGSNTLHDLYGEGVERKQSYEAMVERILSSVRIGKRTCAAFYGHPGVFAFPPHEAIRRAREEGFYARMLPAVSAEDCLFADLGIDPAVTGCQSYEATDFLLYERSVDRSSHLILWQVGVVGDVTFRASGYNTGGLFPTLKARLIGIYGSKHRVAIYRGAMLPGVEPSIEWIELEQFEARQVNAGHTMYVPPSMTKSPHPAVAEIITAMKKNYVTQDERVSVDSPRVIKAKQYLEEGKEYSKGCSEFVCQVLGIAWEEANSLMGDSPVYIGDDNSYPGLVPGDIVGWKVGGGQGHVSVYVGEPGVKFIDVRNPSAKPRRVVNGYGPSRSVFKSNRF